VNKSKLNMTDIKNSLARTWLLILLILAAVSAFLFLAYDLAVQNNISPDSLIRDPTATADMPFYVGSLSIIGVIMWSAAASLCFMAALLLKNKSRKFWFLLSAGIFTTILALDDALQFHQQLFPNFLNVPEWMVYLFYLVYIAAFLLIFSQEIFNETDFLLLGVALLSMFGSIFIDKFINLNFLEDSFKFMGITFWLAYFSRTAVNLVREAIHPDQSTQGN
jgi:hypothetical protein